MCSFPFHDFHVRNLFVMEYLDRGPLSVGVIRFKKGSAKYVLNKFNKGDSMRKYQKKHDLFFGLLTKKVKSF